MRGGDGCRKLVNYSSPINFSQSRGGGGGAGVAPDFVGMH